MSIKKNPFGVGYSGTDAQVTATRKCACCRLPGTFTYNRTSPNDPVWCHICTSHKATDDESVETRLARSETHNVMVWERAQAMGEMAADNKRDAERQRQRVRAALQDRDLTMETLSAVEALHVLGPDRCSCGVRNCATEALLSRGSIGRRLGTNPFAPR